MELSIIEIAIEGGERGLQHGANPDIGFRSLMAAIVKRAIEDLKGGWPYCRKKDMDSAMTFILSDACEAFCFELDIDYRTVREKAIALY